MIERRELMICGVCRKRFEEYENNSCPHCGHYLSQAGSETVVVVKR